MKIKTIFIYSLIGAVLLLQALLVTPGFLSHISRESSGDGMLRLQGKDEERSIQFIPLARMRPALPGSLAQVPGLLPGEGKEYPQTPMITRDSHPLLFQVQDNPTLGFLPGEEVPGIRIFVLHAVILNWNGPLTLTGRQAAVILEVMNRRVAAQKAADNFIKMTNGLLTPIQRRWIESIPPGELEPAGVETAALPGLLLKTLSGPVKTLSRASYSLQRPGELRGRTNTAGLLRGIYSLQTCGGPGLTPAQAQKLRQSLKQLESAWRKLPPRAGLDLFFSPSQRRYVSLCFSDRAYLDRLLSSFPAPSQVEPVAGVNGSLYSYFIGILKAKVLGEVHP